jgi:Txe/YoeB family toxin of Txe-Axe toxin-antitoxin module
VPPALGHDGSRRSIGLVYFVDGDDVVILQARYHH